MANTEMDDILGYNDEYKAKYNMSLIEAKNEMKKTSDPNFNSTITKLASKIVNIEASREIMAAKSLKKEEVESTKELDESFVTAFKGSKREAELKKASLLKRKESIAKQLRKLMELKANNSKRFDQFKAEACKKALEEIAESLKQIEDDIKGGAVNDKGKGSAKKQEGSENKESGSKQKAQETR